MQRITETVKHLLIINGIFFFAANLLGEAFIDLMALHFYKNPFIWTRLGISWFNPGAAVV